MELFILLVLSFCCCRAGALEGQQIDCDDPKVFNAVDLALQAYNDRKDGNQFALVQVLDARETAGPGTNLLVKYRLKETSCAVGHGSWQECEYSSDPDSGRCEAQVQSTGGYSSVSQTCTILPAPERVFTSLAACLGCWYPIANDSYVLLPIVRYTIRQFNNQSEHPSFFEVEEISDAQRQVVSGWKYKFVYSLKETNCSKTEFSELTPECKPIPGGRLGNCQVTAYVNISNTLVYATQDCKYKDHFPLHCFGCEQNIATNNPDLLKAVDVALEKYNNESSDNFYYKIKQIIAATSQIVAGINYRVAFTIIKTNCSKDSFHKLSKSCAAAQPPKLLDCRSTIYMRSWEYLIFPKVTCTKVTQLKTDSLTENNPLAVTPPIQRYIAGLTPFRKSRQAVNLPVFSPKSENRPGGGHSPSHIQGYRPGHVKHGYKKQKTRSSREDRNNQEAILFVPVTENSDQPFTVPQEEDPTINASGTPAAFPDLSLPDSTRGPLFDALPGLPEKPVFTCPGKLWKPLIVLTTPVEETVSPTNRAFQDFDLLDALSVQN